MNILKFFRKPYFAIVLSISVLIVSCSQTDSFQEDSSANIIINNLSTQRVVSSNDVSKIYDLEKFASNNNPSPETNLNIYQNWLSQNDTHLNIKNIEEFKNVMNSNSIEENINFAVNSGIYSKGEINALNNLSANILRTDATMSTFGQVIFKFQDDISKLNLSKEKSDFYESYFSALDLLNKTHPETYGYTQKKITKSCAIATAGLVVAFAGLATLEVGSGGLATGIVIAGWLLACASWGDSCN